MAAATCETKFSMLTHETENLTLTGTCVLYILGNFFILKEAKSFYMF